MSKIVLNNGSLSESITSEIQQLRKRPDSEEPDSSSKKKIKKSSDVTTHWKNIYKKTENVGVKAFECKSKNDCEIIFICNYSYYMISNKIYFKI